MILDRIIADTRLRLEGRRELLPTGVLLERIADTAPPMDMAAALRRPGVQIVAEVKRASPSRGRLCPSLRAEQMAIKYASAGAAAISVLTEEAHFCGSLDDLADTRRGLREVSIECPLLRKDFIVDPYQVLETRAWGADGVLLIVAGLDDPGLVRLHEMALDLGLTPLVEVHNEEELARALPLEPRVIGINNRDLKSFVVDLEVTRRLRPLVPPDCVLISESGIHETAQMRELASLGVDAALIGEALVTAADSVAKLRELKEAAR